MGVFIPTELRLRDALVEAQKIPFPESEERDTIPNRGGLNYNFGTTNQQITILEVDTGERLYVQFVPENISTVREANLTEIMVVARNHPLLHYVNGKNSLNTTLEFYSDEPGRQDVYRKIRWLESLSMNDGYQGKIRNVAFLMGKMFEKDYWVMQSVRTIYSHFDSENDFYPLRATVVINLMQDTDIAGKQENLLISDVRL